MFKRSSVANAFKSGSVHYEFVLHVHSLQPWPAGYGELGLDWERGTKRKGTIPPVQAQPDRESPFCRYDFDKRESIHIPCTLFPNPDAPNGRNGYQKKVLCLSISAEIRNSKGKVKGKSRLGSVVINLADFARGDQEMALQLPVACTQKITDIVGQPYLDATLTRNDCGRPASNSDGTSSHIGSHKGHSSKLSDVSGSTLETRSTVCTMESRISMASTDARTALEPTISAPPPGRRLVPGHQRTLSADARHNMGPPREPQVPYATSSVATHQPPISELKAETTSPFDVDGFMLEPTEQATLMRSVSGASAFHSRHQSAAGDDASAGETTPPSSATATPRELSFAQKPPADVRSKEEATYVAAAEGGASGRAKHEEMEEVDAAYQQQHRRVVSSKGLEDTAALPPKARPAHRRTLTAPVALQQHITLEGVPAGTANGLVRNRSVEWSAGEPEQPKCNGQHAAPQAGAGDSSKFSDIDLAEPGSATVMASRRRLEMGYEETLSALQRRPSSRAGGQRPSTGGFTRPKVQGLGPRPSTTGSTVNGTRALDTHSSDNQANGMVEGPPNRKPRRSPSGEGSWERVLAELRSSAALEASIYLARRRWQPESTGRARSLYCPARRLARTIMALGPQDGAAFGLRALRTLRQEVDGCLVDCELPACGYWWSNLLQLRWMLWAVCRAPGSGEAHAPGDALVSLQSIPEVLLPQLKDLERHLFCHACDGLWRTVMLPAAQDIDVDPLFEGKNATSGEVAAHRWLVGLQAAANTMLPLHKSSNQAVQDLRQRLLLALLKHLDDVLMGVIVKERRRRSSTVSSMSTPSADREAAEDNGHPRLPSSLLLFRAKVLTFGEGVTLKMALTRWQEWARGQGIRDNEDEPLFPQLRAAADLLMFPKDMLRDPVARKELLPALNLVQICAIVSKFVPDDYAPDSVPRGLVTDLQSAITSYQPLQQPLTWAYDYLPEEYLLPRKLVYQVTLDMDDSSDTELNEMEALYALPQAGEDRVVRYQLLRDLWASAR